MCLETALFILLLDGQSVSEEEDYLRLHRKIAPFKVSFAVNSQSMSVDFLMNTYKNLIDCIYNLIVIFLSLPEQSTNEAFLSRLATLLYHKLESNNISAWLPDFSLPLDLQVLF